MPLFSFVCEDMHVTERLASRETVAVDCDVCGEPSERQAVNRIGISGFAATPPDAMDMRHDFRRFTEASQQLNYKHGKAEQERGQSLPAPPLWSAAKQKAARTTQET